jgi:hypothetical protein
MLATFVAFQGRYLVAVCFLTHKMKITVPEASLKMAFSLAIMEIETYGLIEIFYYATPSFICGALVTAVVDAIPQLAAKTPGSS